MKKIAMVYPSLGSNGLWMTLEKVFRRELEDENIDFVHCGESTVMRDIKKYGGLTPNIRARLMCMFEAAVRTHPDVVICTCSSIGEAAETAASLHDEVPILRIDEAMAHLAVGESDNIAVLGTLQTTMVPSVRLVERVAREKGKTIRLTSKMADGVRDAQKAGRPEQALELLRAAALETGSDTFILAQASMEPLGDALREATGCRVYTSPVSCAREIRKRMNW